MKPLPELLLPAQKHNYSALQVEPPLLAKTGQKTNRCAAPQHRPQALRYPAELGRRSARGVLRRRRPGQLLVAEAAHPADRPALPGVAARRYARRQADLVHDRQPALRCRGQGGSVHGVDHERKVAHTIAAARRRLTEIFPLVNNFDPDENAFMPSIGDFLSNRRRARPFRRSRSTSSSPANPSYHGLSLDFEEIPSEAQPGYMALLAALYQDFQPRKLKLYVNTPVGNRRLRPEVHRRPLRRHSADELRPARLSRKRPGPLAAQDWFLDNLKNALKVVPKEKLICSLGSYGYDWTMPLPPAPPKRKGRKPAPEPKVKVLSSEMRCRRRRRGRRRPTRTRRSSSIPTR